MAQKQTIVLIGCVSGTVTRGGDPNADFISEKPQTFHSISGKGEISLPFFAFDFIHRLGRALTEERARIHEIPLTLYPSIPLSPTHDWPRSLDRAESDFCTWRAGAERESDGFIRLRLLLVRIRPDLWQGPEECDCQWNWSTTRERLG